MHDPRIQSLFSDEELDDEDSSSVEDVEDDRDALAAGPDPSDDEDDYFGWPGRGEDREQVEVGGTEPQLPLLSQGSVAEERHSFEMPAHEGGVGEGSSDLDDTPGQQKARGIREGKGWKCVAILSIMDALDAEGIDINDFLDWAFWGDEECFSDPSIRGLRRRFLHGKRAEEIIRRWHTPPRSNKSKKSRPAGGLEFLNKFAIEIVIGLINKEMPELEKLNRVDDKDVDRNSLTSFSIPEMEDNVRTLAPTCWRILHGIAQTKRQKKENQKKDPTKVCTSRHA